jgi:hypothetical protein
MTKSVLLLLMLMARPALSQVVTGSFVAFNLTKSKIIVAADSRGVDNNTGNADDSYCKISAFRNQFIFTSVGGARLTTSPFNPSITGWTNSDLAGDAVSRGANRDDMDDLATDWAISVGRRWISLCGLDQKLCAKLAASAQGCLTTAIFFRAKDLSYSVGNIFFYPSDLANPVKYSIGHQFANCWPCGQTDGSQICVMGEHFDVTEKFCSERKPHSTITIRTPLQGVVTEETKLPISLVEMTIDAYQKSAGDVGGPVDVVTITPNGGVTWNARKKNCPEDH